MLKRDFKDSAHWDKLIESATIPYTLPAWNKSCTVKDMEWWLKQFRYYLKGFTINATEHKKKYSTSLQEFIDLNPTWPLRAWVGLMLEEYAEQHQTT